MIHMKKIQLLSILLVMFLSFQKDVLAKKGETDHPINLAASLSAQPSFLSGSGTVTFTISGLDSGGGTAEIILYKSITGPPIQVVSTIYSEGVSSKQITASVSETTKFKARVTYIDGFEPAEFTSVVTITVGPADSGGILTSNGSIATRTICSGDAVTLAVNGASGTINWKSSENGDAWISLGNLGSSHSFNPDLTTRYRVFGGSSGSNIFTVNVTSSSEAGFMTLTNGGLVTCGDNFGRLDLNLEQLKGEVVRWEQSVNGGGYTPITYTVGHNFKGISYAAVVLSNTTTTYRYKAVVQSGSCASDYALSSVFTAHPIPAQPGVPSLSSNTCGPKTVSLIVPDGKAYYWVTNLNNPDDASSVRFYGNKTVTSGGHIMSKLGTCWSEPRAVGFVYKPLPIAGTLSAPDGSLLCSTNGSVMFKITGHDAEYIRWKKNGVYIPGTYFEGVTDYEVNGHIEQSFSISQSTTFTAVFSNDLTGACTASTLSLPIEFKPPPHAGVLVIDGSVNEQHICDGDNITIDITGTTAGDLFWESNENGAGWEPIVDFSPSLDTKYRVTATQPGCPGSDVSNVLIVNVATASFGGNVRIEEGQAEACLTNTGVLELLNHEGKVIRWEVSVNGGDFGLVTDPQTDQIELTSLPYNADLINNTHTTYIYRAVVKSGTCQEEESTEMEITVYALPQVYVVGGDFSIFIDNASVPLSARLVGEATDLTNGNWSFGTGTGILGFQPEFFGVGVHSISYSYTDPVTACTGVGEVIIDILALPQVNNTGDECLYLGESRTLSVDPIYSSYQWYKNGEIIIDETSNTLVIDEVGSYAVAVTTNSGYSGTSVLTVIRSAFDCQDINYVETKNYTFPTDDETYIPDLKTEAQQSTTYYDGLGRAMQTVDTQSSPTGDDIIQPIVYDRYGRQTNQYLPYIANESGGLYKSTSIVEQADFYSDPSSKVAIDTRPFSEVVFEASPLNRPSLQYGPGEAWKTTGSERPINYTYEINSDLDVHLWVIEDDYPVFKDAAEYYSAGELFKNVTIDEQGHEVIEFVDKIGKTILKRVQVDEAKTTWADTYYVYDDFGNLRFVLPPEGTKALTN